MVTSPKHTEDKYRDMNLSENCESRIATGERLIRQIREKREGLPWVGPDGKSKHPLAEDLYADVYDLEQSARRDEKGFYDCLIALDGELARLRRNGQVLESGQLSLHGSGPRTGLQEAGQIVNARYERILGQRARIESLLARLQQVLKEPARQWPLGIPRKRPRYGAGLDIMGSTSPPLPSIAAGVPAAPRTKSAGSVHPDPRIPAELRSLGSSVDAGGTTAVTPRQGQYTNEE